MKVGRLFFAVAGVLIAGGLAIAQEPAGANAGPGPGGFALHQPPMEHAFGFDGAHGQWWNNPRIVAQLKRKAMDGILQEHRMRLIDLRANLEKAELTMRPLIDADQPNENAIVTAIDKVAQARAELEKTNARFLLALRAKLTPEQWKQLQTLRAEHGPERGKMGIGDQHPGHPGPGGPGQAHKPAGAPGPEDAPAAGPQGGPESEPAAPPAPGNGNAE
jgi:Spy/CpxP family protein refolding chaperone